MTVLNIFARERVDFEGRESIVAIEILVRKPRFCIKAITGSLLINPDSEILREEGEFAMINANFSRYVRV